jgi:signal transduction histidine kinase
MTVSLRRRLERAACAEHELRGPLAAVALAVEQVRQGRSGPELAAAMEAQLDRFSAALADLAEVRSRASEETRSGPVALERVARSTASGWRPIAERAGRGLRVDWRAGPVTVPADRGRLAQALGNLLSNAVEHGEGDVLIRGRRVAGAVRIEVANAVAKGRGGGRGEEGGIRPLERGAGRTRGRGLAIAARAARASGGRLEIAHAAGGVMTALELPVDRW